ncbi:MAG: MBL fold metallo-hydrolase [Gammaproteobacteria bacterium]|nr:MAG: MBL fold metallo-hydrolase [Gammaproteobacteria bacterium]
MEIKTFYHKDTNTFSYIVYEPTTKDAVIFDCVLDYHKASSTISYDSVEEVIDFLQQQQLVLHYIIESHIHADHLSAAQYLKSKYPLAKTAVSTQITLVQETFSKIYNFADMSVDGSQFDSLFADGDIIEAGKLTLNIMHTPGHTPTCMSVLIEDCLFTGDSLFIPDFGTGRCDFPNGSAEQLYSSVSEKLYTLPDKTRVFVGHDYQPGGRELRSETSILESKKHNIQLTEQTSREEFVDFRTARDKLLSAPTLLLPSIQINMQAGLLPIAEDNEVSYLKIPLSIK